MKMKTYKITDKAGDWVAGIQPIQDLLFLNDEPVVHGGLRSTISALLTTSSLMKAE